MTTLIRRRRSPTIEADNFEEFLRLSIVSAAPPKAHSINDIPECQLASELESWMSSNPPRSIPNYSDQGVQPSSGPATYWNDEDFDYQRPLPKACVHEELKLLPRRQHNLMVIGVKGCGRHHLINSLFEPSKDGDDSISTQFDLLVKEKQEANNLNLFKFWIKDASCRRFHYLFRLYYQKASIFLFVYRQDDRASFECLNEAIREVKEEIPNSNFVGFLVGIKPENANGCVGLVDYKEGERLKEKHGLTGFLEIHSSPDEKTKNLFNVLCAE